MPKFHAEMIFNSKDILRNVFYLKWYSSLWCLNFQSLWNGLKYVTLCAIFYHSYNLKYVKNTHGGVYF